MFLIYLRDGMNVHGARRGEFEGAGSVLEIESCKIVFLGRHFLFTYSDTFALVCIVWLQTDNVIVPIANHTECCMIG